ncbi:MAG TPA: hypothetical protein VHZ95_19510, partial [Polyangiales bacterium]|nr:hypothetical protein [Polyangiales bacterium]
MSHASTKQPLIAVPNLDGARQSGRYAIDEQRTEPVRPLAIQRPDATERIARLMEINSAPDEELAWLDERAKSSRPPERGLTSAVFAKEGEDPTFGALRPFYREPTLERVQLQFEDRSLDPSLNPLALSSLTPPVKRAGVPRGWAISVGALALASVGYLAALIHVGQPSAAATVVSPARRALAPHVVAIVAEPSAPTEANAREPVEPALEPAWSVVGESEIAPSEVVVAAAPSEILPTVAPNIDAPTPAPVVHRRRALRARAARVAAPSLVLPAQPTREEIRTGLEAARSALQSCAGPAHGLSTAHVNITGAGRVASATIEGTFAGTPEGSCMARALRTVSFP